MKNILTQDQINDIHALCKKYNITDYTINNDGTIDVMGDVNLRDKKLTQLPIKFNKVSGDFNCNINRLTSLIGSPSTVGGKFTCTSNLKLTSLEGGPSIVGGDFGCSANKISSLIGAPSSVGGDFYCSKNLISSFEGLPKHIGKNIYFSPNAKLSYIYSDIQKELDIDFKIFVKYMNQYDVWTPEYNKDNAQELIDEIKDGLR